MSDQRDRAVLDPFTQLVKAAVLSALEDSGRPLRNRLLTREQAAEYLGIEPDAVDRLHHHRKLPRVKLSERVFRYDLADLDRCIEESK